MRSMIVREESLAGFSRDCGFDQFIKLGKGEEKSGGRNRDTILGDLFEAYGWQHILVKDGNDLEAIALASSIALAIVT